MADERSRTRTLSGGRSQVEVDEGQALAPRRLLAGRYHITAFLAEGASGEVYAARDEQLSEDVALKVLRGGTPDAERLSRLVEETRLARLVTHANVCRVFDLVTDGPVTCLTMELLQGEGLDARLGRGPLGEAELVEVFSQVAAGLAAAHEAGVVHRDLKPSNVMLVPRPGGGVRAVVTDFGIARRVDTLEPTDEGWVGTPAYVAPEQLQGREVGPAADVYALGVMLFEAASGCLPFEGETSHEVAMRRLAVEAPRLRSVAPGAPPGWDTLVARCLQRDPGARPSPATEVGAALRGGPPTPVRAGRRARAAGAAIAAAVALAGAAASWAWSLPSEARVGLDFTHDFTGQDEWAGRGARRMLEQRLRGERRLTLAALDDANVVLGASLTRPAAGEVRLRLTARRARLGAAAFEAVVSGASVAEAYDRALPALVAAIAQGRPAPPWTPAELEEARRLGARTPEGLQLYRRVTTCMLTTTVYAVSECQALAKTLLDLEPTWPRAWLAEVELAPEPASECALALERTAASTDALGRASLRTRCRDPVRVPGAQLDGSDPLLVYFPPFLEARMDVVVMYMSAFDRRPELAFGDTMRDHVRGEQAENLMRQWAQKAPEALQRLVSLGDLGAVELGEVLHGRHPALQVAKARAWLAALDFSRAQAEAREVVAAEDPLVRLAGLLLFAEAGLYQGELGSALKQLEIAARLSDALNPSVGFAQLTYGALRGTAQLVGDEPTRRSAIERYLKRLRFPAILGAVPLGYELAGEHCPPLPLQHPDKYGANRELMAAAQGRGCASCEEVLAHPVTEEPSVDLVSDQSVLTYLQCARRSGQYALALRAYEQTFQGRMGTLTDRRRSPAHAVLARYELARTLEAMGREAEALAAWKTAARFWQNLDTLRPEPEEARAAIARLSPLGAPGQ